MIVDVYINIHKAFYFFENLNSKNDFLSKADTERDTASDLKFVSERSWLGHLLSMFWERERKQVQVILYMAVNNNGWPNFKKSRNDRLLIQQK